MPTCTRRLEFDAAHRVLRHESKCKHIHGHRYVIEVTCESAKLDGCGRVIDFGVVKKIFGKWLDDNLDHNLIINSDDILAKMWATQMHFSEHDSSGGGSRTIQTHISPQREIFENKQPYVLTKENPTAEVLARHLAIKAQELLKDCGIKVTNIRVYETPNCYADWEPEGPEEPEEVSQK